MVQGLALQALGLDFLILALNPDASEIHAIQWAVPQNQRRRIPTVWGLNSFNDCNRVLGDIMHIVQGTLFLRIQRSLLIRS